MIQRVPPTDNVDAAFLYRHTVPSQQSLYARQERVERVLLFGDVTNCSGNHILVETAVAPRKEEECLELGAKGEAAIDVSIQERLDAKWIARQKQLLSVRIPNCERPHTVESELAARTP